MSSEEKLLAGNGGASLLVAWQLKDRRVLIVGGGDVASGRLEAVLQADAYVTLIAPLEGLHIKTKSLIDKSGRVTHINRAFAGEQDINGVDMVLTAIDDVELSRQICSMCREQRIPVNAADIPPSCDFYFGSQIRQGPLQIMISTNGKGPKLANIIKMHIQRSLPLNVDQAIDNVGKLRLRLRQIAPGVGGSVSKNRMQWISKICSTWSLEELARLDEFTIDAMLDSWRDGQIPKPTGRKPPRVKFVLAGQIFLAFVVGVFIGLALSLAFFCFNGYFGDPFLDIPLINHALTRISINLNTLYQKIK